MKYLKYGLYALIVLVALVGAAFAYIAATFDPNEYKGDVVALVKEETGRTLNIEGDISLTFFPKIGVSLGPTQLSERDSETEFAGVDDLRVALALLPLLSKQIVVDEIVIDGLRARLIKRADGSTNIDDLTKPAEADEAATEETAGDESGEAAGPAMTLDVQGVRIRNGTFSYRDEQADASYEVSELDLQTGRVAESVPTPFEYSAVVRADKPQLDLRTHASGVLEADTAAQLFKVTDLQAGAEGLAATISDLKLTVSASDVEAQPATQKTAVSALNVKVSGAQAGNTFSATIGAPRLAISQDEAAGDVITAVVQARGPEMRADADIRLSAVKGSPSALNIDELAIDLDAEQGENTVKGRVSTPVSGDLEKQRFGLTKIVGEYEVRSPALPMKSTTIPLSGSVDADVMREVIKADLKTRFDESNIEGVFNIRAFAEPFIGFDAAIDKLNLDRYRPAEETKQEEKKKPTAEDGEKGETRIDLSPLKALNLDGKLRVGSLIASNVKLSDVRITLKARDGKVEINPLLAKLYGGSVRSVVTADANTNAFAVKQSLSGVTIGPLLQDALDKDLLEGRGSVDLDLTAQGDTVGALTKTLTGDAGVELKDGAVKGINLAQSLRSAKDMLSLKRNQETAASPTEKTDFSELKASFRIDNGQARNDDLTLSSPFIRLTGAGSLNLVEGSIDYVANTSLVATSKGQGGKDLSDVAGFTVPLRVTGPLTALNYELQFSDAIELQAKQRLKAEEKKLKQKLESTLTEQLLGGNQDDSDATKEDAAPSAKPEDELKKRLKDLFR
ncbi:MAG: AsmA family protein [Betaproteobacteria bacterium]|nr:MAG: AsmA family protein [Betaproteobacteria bacterium]